jgi:hypothetical protein
MIMALRLTVADEEDGLAEQRARLGARSLGRQRAPFWRYSVVDRVTANAVPGFRAIQAQEALKF